MMHEDESYYRALAEVDSFLQHCDEEITEKIPQKLMDFLSENKVGKAHITKISDLSREAQGIIALLNLVYLIAPEEKEAHRLIVIKNELTDILKNLWEQESDENVLQMLQAVQKAETKEELSPFLEIFKLETAFEDLEKDEEEFRRMFF